MLKPNRLVAMATTGKLADDLRDQQRRYTGGSTPPPRNAEAGSDLLESLANGLRRLCQLAFGPNQQVHELASKAVTIWTQTAAGAVAGAVETDQRSGQIQDRHIIAVRLLAAIALYVELCQRERHASATGVIEPAAISRLLSACDGHVPPEAVARCPALRRLLNQFQLARPSTGRPKRIAAA